MIKKFILLVSIGFSAVAYAQPAPYDTNASTICSGTTTYLDGEGNCDDISSVYEPLNSASDTECLWLNGSTIDGIATCTTDGTDITMGGTVTYTDTTDGGTTYQNSVKSFFGSGGFFISANATQSFFSWPSGGQINLDGNVIVDTLPTTLGAGTSGFTINGAGGTSGSSLYVTRTPDTTGSSQAGWPVVYAASVWNSTDDTTGAVGTLKFSQGASAGSHAQLYGISGQVGTLGTANVTLARGVYSEPTFALNTSSMTTYNAFETAGPQSIAAGASIGTWRGGYIANGAAATGTFGTSEGIRIQQLTRASTNREFIIEDAGKAYFRDDALSIGSSTDGQIDFDADGLISMNTPALAVSYLTSCDTIDTDGSGNFTCGTDADTDTQNTLDQAYDEGGAGSGRSITADSGAVEITVSDTSNNAALSLIQNDTTNNPNTLAMTNAGTGKPIAIENTETTTDPIDYEFYSNDTGATLEDMQTLTFYEDNASGTKTPVFQLAHVASGIMTAGDELGVGEVRVSDQGSMSTMFQFFGGTSAFPTLRQSVFYSHLHFATGYEYAISGGQYAFVYNPGGTAFPAHSLAGIQFVATGTTGINFINTLGQTVERHDVVNNRSEYRSGYLFDALVAGGTLQYGTVNAGALTYGNATNTTSQTFTTDGTGNGEIVLPADSVGPSEIDDTTGDWNFSSVTSLKVPNGSNPTVDATGKIAEDTTNNQLLYGSTPNVLSPRNVICSQNSRITASGDDNITLVGIRFPFGVTITSVVCRCTLNCTDEADIRLEDASGNAMTQSASAECEGTAGTTDSTPQSVTAGNTLNAGEGLRFDVTGTNTALQNVTICVGWEETRT